MVSFVKGNYSVQAKRLLANLKRSKSIDYYARVVNSFVNVVYLVAGPRDTMSGLGAPGFPYRCSEVLLALRLTRRPALPVIFPCFI